MITLFAKSQIKKCDLTNGLGLHPGRPKSLPIERNPILPKYCQWFSVSDLIPLV